ncbi:MAG: PQQ-dependent sugar dehydrogenase, partial [Bdellovibrionales bacterium]|nr:PQQ-dependent sugar dehydrogenase [Bdellovibrionales bacterium]
MLKLLILTLLTISVSSQAASHKLIFKTKDTIWGFDFIDNDKVIYTEKSGVIKLYDFKTKKHITLAKPAMVAQKGQGGLLDIKTHPEFSTNKKIYFTYAKQVNDEHTTALAYGTLKNNKLTEIKEIFTAQALSSKGQHFGARIVFDQNNKI